MMNDAYDLWRDLEKESGTTLYRSEFNHTPHLSHHHNRATPPAVMLGDC